jgi:hypothetical protein
VLQYFILVVPLSGILRYGKYLKIVNDISPANINTVDGIAVALLSGEFVVPDVHAKAFKLLKGQSELNAPAPCIILQHRVLIRNGIRLIPGTLPASMAIMLSGSSSPRTKWCQTETFSPFL